MMRSSTGTELSTRRSAREDGTLCAIAAAFAGVLAGCQQSPSTIEHACSDTQATSQAISVANLTGASLPPKTLALTFDDGPGLRTSELSTFLKNQGIAAGFFVNGRMIQDNVVLTQLIADGHVIGNHTQTHTSLTGHSTGSRHLDDANTVSELAQTDALIAPFVTANRFMFRAPYGDFDGASAAAINASAMSKYVGPIYWNIGNNMGPHQAVDWDCWQSGNDGAVLTVARCGELYLEEIDAVGRGVILMHDPYFIGGNPANGGTVDMVENIVPVLKAKGYKFVRVDEVPEIAAGLPPLPAPPPPPTPDPGASTSSGRPSRTGGTYDGWATTSSSNPSAPGATPAPGVVAPSTETGAPVSEAPVDSASAGGGKPDPCPSSPQRKAAK
jgi:peptidoglycan/xylan/chitin deacetylase (PgdA/CDA1 family)